jgi:hypothetical protein
MKVSLNQCKILEPFENEDIFTRHVPTKASPEEEEQAERPPPGIQVGIEQWIVKATIVWGQRHLACCECKLNVTRSIHNHEIPFWITSSLIK